MKSLLLECGLKILAGWAAKSLHMFRIKQKRENHVQFCSYILANCVINSLLLKYKCYKQDKWLQATWVKPLSCYTWGNFSSRFYALHFSLTLSHFLSPALSLPLPSLSLPALSLMTRKVSILSILIKQLYSEYRSQHNILGMGWGFY